MSENFPIPTRSITLPSRAVPVGDSDYPAGAPSRPLTAEYLPHELGLMKELSKGLEDPETAKEAANEIASIHELKSLFPGSHLLTDEEHVAGGYDRVPGDVVEVLGADVEPEPEDEQLDLDEPDWGPKARTSDPRTSHEAAELVEKTKAGTQRQLLWEAFLSGDALTDEEAATRAGVPLASEYATRCSELRNAWMIEETGEERAGAAGVKRIVSRITTHGSAEYERKFR